MLSLSLASQAVTRFMAGLHLELRPVICSSMTDKEIAVETLARLPESASLAQITEELQVMAAIREGQADAAAGRVRSHTEVKQLFSSWIDRWTTMSRSSP